jgi:hypothetical protein
MVFTDQSASRGEVNLEGPGGKLPKVTEGERERPNDPRCVSAAAKPRSSFGCSGDDAGDREVHANSREAAPGP